MRTAIDMKELTESQLDSLLCDIDAKMVNKAEHGLSSLTYDFHPDTSFEILRRAKNMLVACGYAVNVYSNFRFVIQW
jgi:hypothetical protein